MQKYTRQSFSGREQTIGHTVKALLVIRTKTGDALLMVHEKPRNGGYAQKDGTVFPEFEKWGLPGGKREKYKDVIPTWPYDPYNPKVYHKSFTGDFEAYETIEETIVREIRAETGLLVVESMFDNELSFDGETYPSKRVGYDLHQEHYFFADLTQCSDMKIITPTEGDEVVEWKFIRFEKIPLPSEKRRTVSLKTGQYEFSLSRVDDVDTEVPFTMNQLRGLIRLLRHLKDMEILDADRWLAAVEKRAANFLEKI